MVGLGLVLVRIGFIIKGAKMGCNREEKLGKYREEKGRNKVRERKGETIVGMRREKRREEGKHTLHHTRFL